jgi:hypothetical protein
MGSPITVEELCREKRIDTTEDLCREKRRDLAFEIVDFVYLKVSLVRGLCGFKVKENLAPRYIRPFKIIDRKGEVPCQLKLPPQLLDVHDVFLEEQLPMEELDLGGMSYNERPIKILEIVERVTRSKVIKMCKVLWSHLWKMKLHGSIKKISEQIIPSCF